MAEKLIVVGNGMAGVRVVENILAADPDRYDITVINEESVPGYNRILLSEVLQGEKTWDGIMTNDFAWYEDNGVDLINGEALKSIDREAKKVITEYGRELDYDKLVLAVGSTPFILPIPGHDLDNVMPFRSIADGQRLEDLAREGKKIAFIGGGLVGLEGAVGLQRLGAEVSVIELAPWLMAAQLDETAGALLREDLEKMGLNFLLGVHTEAIQDNGAGAVGGVTFTDHDPIAADVVVMSLGIRPNIAVAQESGLDTERGIVVNEFMQTSDEDIFAIGECTQYEGRCIGTVAPAYAQAKIAANVLTGQSTDKFAFALDPTELKVPGIDLYSVGTVKEDPEAGIRSIRAIDDVNHTYKHIFVDRDNHLVGEILYGDIHDSQRYFSMLKRGIDLSDLTPTALLLSGAGESDEDDIADMPDDEIVCSCNGVSKGEIVGAIETEDCNSVMSVGKATRAGTSCGKCKPVIQKILEYKLGDDVAAAKDVMCGCTDLSHDEICGAIRASHWLHSQEVRDGLGWRNPEGCEKCRPAVNYYLNMIFPEEHIDERDSRVASERYLGNIQKDGTFSVIPRLKGGQISPEELRRIAHVAEKYSVPMMKVVTGQRLGLYGIQKQDLPQVWSDLGMDAAEAYEKVAIREIKTCVGSDWCRFGTINTQTLAEKIDQSYNGVDSPHKIKLGISGCPRSCAESLTKDFAVIGEVGGYQIYIGGANAVQVIQAQHVVTVHTEEEVLEYLGAFLQWYRENGTYAQRPWKLIQEVGVDNVIDMLNDEEQRKALVARIEKAKAAYAAQRGGTDPWHAALKEDSPQSRLYVVRDIPEGAGV